MEEKSVPNRQYTEELTTEDARLCESAGQHEAVRWLGIPI